MTPGTMAARLTRLSTEPYRLPQHLRLIDSAVIDAFLGRGPKRVMVMTPPGHGKSEYASRWLPVWCLSEFPDYRVGMIAHTAEFASEWGRKARNTINEHSAELGISVAQDSKAASKWHVNGHRGGMITAGLGGAITGRRLNVAICDDLVKSAEEARSSLYRERAWQWWNEDFVTRLEPDAVVVFIMTRRHEDDLMGRLLEREAQQWRVLKFPALCVDPANDLLGRAEGEAVWPERFDVNHFRRLNIPNFAFEALYQQNPTPESGNYFKRENWRYLRMEYCAPPRHVVQVVDTAIGLKEEQDYSVIATWWVLAEGYLLRRIMRAKMQYPDLVRAIISEYEWARTDIYQMPPSAIVVEDKTSGRQALQSLERETRLPIQLIKADTDKLSRAEPAIGMQESHRLFLAEGEAWVNDFVREHAEFPRGAHDDQVDTTAHAVNYLKRWEPVIDAGVMFI